MNDLTEPSSERPVEQYADQMSPGLIGGVADWIMDAALEDTPMDALLGGVCARLLGAGVPIARVHLSYRTLHPAIESVSLIWSPDRAVESMEHMHGAGSSGTWMRSPFYFMIQNQLSVLRRRLAGPAALLDFPVLDDLAADGMTDYVAQLVEFDTNHDDVRRGIVTSWATARPNGFVDADIQAMLRVKQRLGVAAKLAIKTQIANNVVNTYLGPRAGGEVLSGSIQRGDGHTIHAVVYYSDLRNSSALADRLPSSRYIALLNGYFECAAGAVLEAGGEVLNYIGDSVLAIFPIGEQSAEEATEAALRASLEARGRLEDVNANLDAIGADQLEFGVGLHIGDVVFGNIGAGDRLAFTTIGAAVNEVARLEELCKTMPSPVLMSGEFRAGLAPKLAGELAPYGFQKLRGIGAPLDVFGLPEASSTEPKKLSPPTEAALAPIADC